MKNSFIVLVAVLAFIGCSLKSNAQVGSLSIDSVSTVGLNPQSQINIYVHYNNAISASNFLRVNYGTSTANINMNNTLPTGFGMGSGQVVIQLNGLAMNQTYYYKAITTYPVPPVESAIGNFTTTSCSFTANQTPTGTNYICAGDSILLNASPSNGAYTYTYQWQKNGSNIPNAIGSSYSANSAGSYACIVNNGACASTTPSTNVANSVVNLTTGNVTICQFGSAQLNATGATTYSWSPTTGLSNPNIANPIASPTSTTTYVVTGYTGNCSSTSQVVVTVNGTMNLTTSGNASVCKGSSVPISASASNATNYVWSPSIGLSNANISNPIASPTVTTTYTVNTSNGVCTSTAQVVVTVNSVNAAITTSTNNVLCFGDSIRLTAGGGGTSHYWSNGMYGSNIWVKPNVTTTYGMTMTIGSCTGTANITITVIPQIPLIVSGVDKICNGSSTDIYASGADTYKWSSGEITPTITVSPTTTTAYTVTATIGSCSAVKSYGVNVYNPPVVSSAVFSNGTLTLNGTFPGKISKISINGQEYIPQVGNATQALFINVILYNGDIVLVTTINSDCFFIWHYVTVGLEDAENTPYIKEGDQIYLYDITGRIIKKINSPKNISQKEIYEIGNLFGNIIPGLYIFRSGDITKKIKI